MFCRTYLYHRNGLCVGVLLAILPFNGKAHFPLTPALYAIQGPEPSIPEC